MEQPNNKLPTFNIYPYLCIWQVLYDQLLLNSPRAGRQQG
jgi:hypothetical protein